MTAWFTPDAANFFGRISRNAIRARIRQAKDAGHGPGLEKLNVGRAARLLEGTGSLPAPIRIDPRSRCHPWLAPSGQALGQAGPADWALGQGTAEGPATHLPAARNRAASYQS